MFPTTHLGIVPLIEIAEFYHLSALRFPLNLNDPDLATTSASLRHVHPSLRGQVPHREPNFTLSPELNLMSTNGNMLSSSEVLELRSQYLSQKPSTPEMHAFHFNFYSLLWELIYINLIHYFSFQFFFNSFFYLNIEHMACNFIPEIGLVSLIFILPCTP